MSQIFLDHEDKVFPPDPSPYEPLLTEDERIEEVNKAFKHEATLNVQVLFGYHASKVWSSIDRRRIGRSSIISAYMALGTCEQLRVGPFINNDNLWSD